MNFDIKKLKIIQHDIFFIKLKTEKTKISQKTRQTRRQHQLLKFTSSDA